MKSLMTMLIALAPVIWVNGLPAKELAAEPQTKPQAKPKAVKKPAAKATKPAPSAAPKPIEIPAGAIETAPATYSYTDTKGKKWIYRKTPFGVARLEDNPAAAQAAPAPQAPVKVTAEDRGDTVHFERPGPFGMYKWDRKKSELSPDEKAWLAEQPAGAESGRRQP
jgi:hypothetical protein